MLRLPVVLDISYKAIYGLNFKQAFSGLSFVEGYSLSFSQLEPEEFGQGLLTTFIKRHYPYNTGVYFNLPYEASFVREITVPFTEQRKVQEVIKYELETLLPYAMDEVIFDYYRYPDLKENKTRVIAIGSDKRNLLPYLEMLRENHITVAGIYSPLDSLFHLYRYTNQESCVMLHISSASSLVLIVKEEEWLFSRILPLGYDNLVSRFADKWEKSFEESEKFFLSLPVVNIDQGNTDYLRRQLKCSKSQMKLLTQSIDEFGSILGGELRLTLRSIPNKIYQELKHKLPVVVSSDLRNQSILEDILVEKIDHPIVSFPYERTPMATIPKEQILNFGAVLSQTSKGLQFLKRELKEYATRGQTLGKRPFYTAFAIGIFLFALSYFVNFYGEFQFLKFLEKENQKTYQKYFGKNVNTSSMDILTSAKTEVDRLRRETEVFNVFFRDKTFSDVIVEFNNLFPSLGFVEIEGITYTPKQITFHGKAESSSLLSDMETAAQESSIFSSMNCRQRTTPAKKGGKQWKFHCTLNLKGSDNKKEKGRR